MATISITIPDAVLTRVSTALAASVNWTATINDPALGVITNPETQAQAAKRAVTEFVKTTTVQYEGQVAHQTADATAKSQITIT